MKNQNDLIVAGAVVLVCIGVSLAFMFTKREPTKPADPPSIVTKDAEPSAASVVYANSLPSEKSTGSGAEASAGFVPNRPVAAGAAGGPTAAGAAGGGGGGQSQAAK